MKVQLKPEAPERVEVGNGPRIFIAVRGQELEITATDWPALNQTGYFEICPDKPVAKKSDKDEKK